MRVIVLDSSFVVPIILQEPGSGRAQGLLAAFGGAELIAPALLYWEFANVLTKKLRGGDVTANEVDQLVVAFHQLGLAIVDPPGPAALIDVVGLASAVRLSAYDAAYLDLASRRGGDLATFDERLAKAALGAGLRVEGYAP